MGDGFWCILAARTHKKRLLSFYQCYLLLVLYPRTWDNRMQEVIWIKLLQCPDGEKYANKCFNKGTIFFCNCRNDGNQYLIADIVWLMFMFRRMSQQLGDYCSQKFIKSERYFHLPIRMQNMYFRQKMLPESCICWCTPMNLVCKTARIETPEYVNVFLHLHCKWAWINPMQ